MKFTPTIKIMQSSCEKFATNGNYYAGYQTPTPGFGAANCRLNRNPGLKIPFFPRLGAKFSKVFDIQA
jgi:hypothetical protein